MTGKLGVAVLVAVATVLSAAPAVGQEGSVIQRLSRYQAEYDVALDNHHAAIGARDVQAQRWSDELANVAAAQGDDNLYRAAMAACQAVALELNRLEIRVRQTEDSLMVARGRLLGALDERRDVLQDEYAAASGAEAQQIRALLADVVNQYDSLEAEASANPTPELPLSVTVTLSPRDDRTSLNLKVSILQQQTQDARDLIQQTEREIERLQTRQRMERSGRDFMAGVDRYGAAEPPTGPPNLGSAREGVIPPDSTAAEQTIPLEKRISDLQVFREQLEDFIGRAQARATEFRNRLRIISQ